MEIELANGVPALHPERKGQLDKSPKKNWVEKTGGLPTYINSIATALKRENPTWTTARVIATAVNACKKMCSTGTAFGGKAKVSKAVQAAACAAVAKWESQKVAASCDSDPEVLMLANSGVSIPNGVKNNAQKALDKHKEWPQFGTSVGLATARLLAAGGTISIDKVKHIHKYFARHKAIEDWNDKESAGYWAVMLWGGPGAEGWSKNALKNAGIETSMDTDTGDVLFELSDGYVRMTDEHFIDELYV